jgi:protein TonB
MRDHKGASAAFFRLILFAAVAGLHGIFIFFFIIKVDASISVPEQSALVMKLADIQEEEPPPLAPAPPPPPPPPPEPMESSQNAAEAIAETMIETEEVPLQTLVAAVLPVRPVQRAAASEEEYLPMHKVSIPPVLSERDIKQRLIYPPIALRAGIEGMVYLELFVDHQGLVRQIVILKEEPPSRGFGEAAVKAFQGLRGTPAQANGVAVGVRYRYPVRFAIRS